MTITIDGSAGITFPDDEVQFSAVQNTGGTALLYAARAWGAMDMTGLGLVSAVNILSATVNATGDVSFTFAYPMATENYIVVATGYSTTDAIVITTKPPYDVNGFTLRVTALSPSAGSASTTPINVTYLSFAVFS